MNELTKYAIAWKLTTNPAVEKHLFASLDKMCLIAYRSAYKSIKYVKGANYEEFHSICVSELHRALVKFDESEGYEFNTLLSYGLKRAIRRYLRTLSLVPPSTKATVSDYCNGINKTGTISPPTNNQDDYIDCFKKTYQPKTEFSGFLELIKDIVSDMRYDAIRAWFDERGGMERMEFVERRTGRFYDRVRIDKYRALRKLRKIMKNDIKILTNRDYYDM